MLPSYLYKRITIQYKNSKLVLQYLADSSTVIKKLMLGESLFSSNYPRKFHYKLIGQKSIELHVSRNVCISSGQSNFLIMRNHLTQRNCITVIMCEANHFLHS